MLEFYFRRVLILAAIMLFVLSACDGSKIDPTSMPSTFINEQEAIEQAQLYCGHLGKPQETPHNIEATFSTCREVDAQSSFVSCFEQPPEMEVWIVSMDGQWPRWRGPATNSNATPTPFHHCSVLLDAKTGEEMGLNAN